MKLFELEDLFTKISEYKITPEEALVESVRMWNKYPLTHVQVGEDIQCTKLPNTTKRFSLYTIYTVVKKKVRQGKVELGVVDDNNKRSWIPLDGIMYYTFVPKKRMGKRVKLSEKYAENLAETRKYKSEIFQLKEKLEQARKDRVRLYNAVDMYETRLHVSKKIEWKSI